jgi:hypothetical protein
MRAYGQSLEYVMALPMRLFWHLSGHIDRMHKHEGKLAFEIQASINTPEQAAQMREHLDACAPEPIKMSKRGLAMQEQLDRSGLDSLRNMI